ncbi:MAG: type II toxin-antitoxin system RelE family toxin [Thermoplasmata archaeon]
MRFLLTFSPTADQSFPVLPRWAQARFDDAFDLLEQRHIGVSTDLDVHQLFGYKNVWILRVPPYREIYAIDGREVVMVVFGHRDRVYADLHHLIPPAGQLVSKATLDRRR